MVYLALSVRYEINPWGVIDSVVACLLEQWKGRDDSEPFSAAVHAIIWTLWKSRNDAVFNNHMVRPDLVCQATIRDATEICKAYSIKKRYTIRNGAGRTMFCGAWMAMPSCWMVEDNFDGGIERRREQCVLGMVIRDWRGNFMVATAIHKHVSYRSHVGGGIGS